MRAARSHILKATAAKLTVGAEGRKTSLSQWGAKVIINIARIRVHNDYTDMGSPEHVGGGPAHGRRLQPEIRRPTISHSAANDTSCDRLKPSFLHRDPRSTANRRE